ncbi:peroxisome biogenesis factor 10-like protein [Leptotrombidium deliense]|uniref:RING-type E3 ubiquitin transferase n=1 Tax=Leptotrombidium deliense TaxID=299467 RepID=A0A443S9T8_9ACAR|nr:peroxisome biogenesis factor 10-like protein [Leptotrombidium deliense]
MKSYRISPETAALLRCVQKDEDYQRLLLSQTNQVYEKLFGLRKWLAFRKEIECISRLTYLAVTTLSGLQTLGEEYSDVVQVQGDRLIVPSIFRRIIMCFLHTSTPYLIDKTLSYLSKLVEDPNVRLKPDYLNNPEIRLNLNEFLPKFKHVVEYVNRCHLVLFYFFGTYYDLSKRVTGIKYTAIHSWLSSSSSKYLYKILGSLTMLQLVFSILFQYYSVSLIANTENDASSSVMHLEPGTPKDRCSLCLSKRKDSTTTPCGHLFCWFCICEWIQIKGECPLCRQKVQPSELVFLQNYD